MFLFCNLPAKVQSLYRNCPIRHHLLYFFYLIAPFCLRMQGCAAIKQCSWSPEAMTLGARSNALGCWEQCFQTLGTMLLGAGSIAFGFQKQCSTAFKAMTLPQERPASNIRKQAFFCFSLPTGEGWGGAPLSLGRQRWRATPLLRRGRGRFYFTTTFFPLRI